MDNCGSVDNGGSVSEVISWNRSEKHDDSSQLQTSIADRLIQFRQLLFAIKSFCNDDCPIRDDTMMKAKEYKQCKIVRDYAQVVQTNRSCQPTCLGFDWFKTRSSTCVHKLHLMIQMTQYCLCDAVKSTVQNR